MLDEKYKKRLKYSKKGPSLDVWVGWFCFFLIIGIFAFFGGVFRVMISPWIVAPVSIIGGISSWYGTVRFIDNFAPQGRYLALVPPNKQVSKEVWGSMVETFVNPTPDKLKEVELMALRSNVPCTIMRQDKDGLVFLGVSDQKYGVTHRWPSLRDLESPDKDKLVKTSLYLGIREWPIDLVEVVISVDGVRTKGKIVILIWPVDLLKPLYNVAHLQDAVVEVIEAAWRRVIGRLNYSAKIAEILERGQHSPDETKDEKKLGDMIKDLEIELIEKIGEELDKELGQTMQDASGNTVVRHPVCADDFEIESARDADVAALFKEVYPGITKENCLQVETPAWTICKRFGVAVKVLVKSVQDETGAVTGAISKVVIKYAERQVEIIGAEQKRLVKVALARGERAATVLEISAFDSKLPDQGIDPDKYKPPKQAIEHWKFKKTMDTVEKLPADSRIFFGGKGDSLPGLIRSVAGIDAAIGSKRDSSSKRKKSQSSLEQGESKEKTADKSGPETETADGKGAER